MKNIDGIQVIEWYEHPAMRGVKEVLDVMLPGWGIDGPYCPGKADHWTFKVTQGREEKMVHVHDLTHEVTIEA